MFFQRDRYEFHEREYLFFSREACSGANDHQSAFRKLAALANSNLSTDTSAKCGMSWQSCRQYVRVPCSPFWRFLGESSEKLSRPKTLRHTVIQGQPHSCMTYVTVSKSSPLICGPSRLLTIPPNAQLNALETCRYFMVSI